MPKDAVMWIRDGVLVDRMHVNPVAFAAAYWVFISDEKRDEISIEQLINFGFARSGVSCLQKMTLFNDEVCHLLTEPQRAAVYYNDLATRVAAGCTYFKGLPELLRKLTGAGAANFITSAVEQNVLDEWQKSKPGEQLKGCLQEVLGRRENFSKGEDHFRYVRRFLNDAEASSDSLSVQAVEGASRAASGRIFYVADAASEIQAAQACSNDFGINSIGFAHVITIERVMQAVCMIAPYLSNDPYYPVPYPTKQFRVDPDKLDLPNEAQLVDSLKEAGAPHVVTGEAHEIVENLANHLKNAGLLG